MNPSPFFLFLSCLWMSVVASAMTVTDGAISFESLDDFVTCQAIDPGGRLCNKALISWVDAHPQDAFKAGKLFKKPSHRHAAVPFFAKAWQQNSGDCNDEDVKSAVISALSLPSYGNESVIVQARQIALNRCAKELGDVIAEKAKGSDYILKNCCHELIAKKLLSGTPAKRCSSM